MTNQEILTARVKECERIVRASHQIADAAMNRYSDHAKYGVRHSAALDTARDAQITRAKYSRLAMEYRDSLTL